MATTAITCRMHTAYKIANLLVAAILLALGLIYVILTREFRTIVIALYSLYVFSVQIPMKCFDRLDRLFAILLVLAECGVDGVLKYFGFLNNLFGRGLFYVLVGVWLLNPQVWYLLMLSIIIITLGFLYTLLYFVPSARPREPNFH